jgi:hypothetical protein
VGAGKARRGEILSEPHKKPRYVYFPVESWYRFIIHWIIMEYYSPRRQFCMNLLLLDDPLAVGQVHLDTAGGRTHAAQCGARV